MKNLARPIGLAGIGSHPKAEPREAQFFEWRVAGIALSVAFAYYLGAKIGFALTLQPHPVSVLWPPNSILLAALLLTPVRIWWEFFASSLRFWRRFSLPFSIRPSLPSINLDKTAIGKSGGSDLLQTF